MNPHTPALDSQRWRKSSYSTQDGGNCIEVALTPRTVKIRDSKDTARPGLTVAAETWSAFITGLGGND